MTKNPKNWKASFIVISEAERTPDEHGNNQLVSGHDIGISRDERQIILYVNGTKTYHKSYERMAAELKGKTSSIDAEKLQGIQNLVDAEKNGWSDVLAVLDKLIAVMRGGKIND